MRRYDLTDDQWEVIADLFPDQTMGQPRRSDRTVLNGILCIFCPGAAWRDLPERYGPWRTAHHRFRQWKASGVGGQLAFRSHSGAVPRRTRRAGLDLRCHVDGRFDLRRLEPCSRCSAGEKGTTAHPIRPSGAPKAG